MFRKIFSKKNPYQCKLEDWKDSAQQKDNLVSNIHREGIASYEWDISPSSKGRAVNWAGSHSRPGRNQAEYHMLKNNFQVPHIEEMWDQDLSGNSLAVQWLGLRTFTAKGVGSIPGQGTKIPQDT